VADMNAGAVGALLISDCNPVYNYSEGKKFGEALSKLPLTVSFNATMDETTEQCKYVIPSHHWLESWGDAEPKSGYISLIQPLINPLFKTRAYQTSLLKWIGGEQTKVSAVPVTDSTGKIVAPVTSAVGSSADEYENYLKNYWTGKLGSANLWEKA